MPEAVRPLPVVTVALFVASGTTTSEVVLAANALPPLVIVDTVGAWSVPLEPVSNREYKR